LAGAERLRYKKGAKRARELASIYQVKNQYAKNAKAPAGPTGTTGLASKPKTPAQVEETKKVQVGVKDAQALRNEHAPLSLQQAGKLCLQCAESMDDVWAAPSEELPPVWMKTATIAPAPLRKGPNPPLPQKLGRSTDFLALEESRIDEQNTEVGAFNLPQANTTSDSRKLRVTFTQESMSSQDSGLDRPDSKFFQRHS